MNGHVTLATPGSALPPRHVPSGLDFHDTRTGGLRVGKRYVVGAPRGAGASIAALQIAAAGLREGEVVLVLSAEDPEALLLQGEHAGLPLARFLHNDQCILLGYDRQFAERAANPALAPGLLRDLERKTGQRPLHRAVLLDEPVAHGAAGKVREALDLLDAHLRERGAVVVHVVDPQDSRHADLQRAAFGACVIEPEDGAPGRYGRFRLLKDPSLAGGAVTGRLAVRHGAGFVEAQAESGAACVVWIAAEGRVPDGLGAGFRLIGHDAGDAQPMPADLPPSFLVVVEVDPGSAPSLALLERVRRVEPAAPLVAVTPRPGRSADRVRLLRRGVDEVVDRGTPPAELRERLRRHAARLGLLPPVPPEFSRLEAGHDLAATGPVPWGTFTRSTGEIAAAMGRLGGEFALVALRPRDAKDGVERVAAALGRGLRTEDPFALSPEGVLVVRLYRVGKADLDPMVKRLAARIGADAAAWTAVAFPEDGRDFDELYQGLVRPEGARSRRATESQIL